MGACLRYALSRILVDSGFPIATMLANISGSFVIGLLFVLIGGRLGSEHPAYLLLVVGVLGGFTTFSTFSLDAIRLLDTGRYAAFGLYTAVTVGLCLMAAMVGLMLGRRLM